MTYFYDYYAKEYREIHKDKLLPAPAAILCGIESTGIQDCRRNLKNAFATYNEGGNKEMLKMLLAEYREYIAGLQDEHAKERYNAFVYRYMAETHVGMKAIGGKLGVTKETIYVYINRVLDELLMLCIGMPAVKKLPENKEDVVCILIEGSRIFHEMAGDYIVNLFSGKREQTIIEKSRQLTKNIMEKFEAVVREYSVYCNDEDTRIDTDVRKAVVLEKCIAGVPVAVIAEECGVCENTIYADIRENEKRLAAMLFEM